jgi:hypothetical protein
LDKAACHEEQHWEMQRAKTEWTIVAPSQNISLQRAFVVRIFAQQLAQLTNQSGTNLAVSSATEESHLASLLKSLLNRCE